MKDNVIKSAIADIFNNHHKESVVIVGLGNRDRSDDGIGIKAAEALKQFSPERVFTEEEKSVESLVFDFIENKEIKAIIFIDAADLGGLPGETELFSASDIDKFVPTFSTHKVPITVLMNIIAKRGMDPYFIGIQPETLKFMGSISSVCAESADSIIKFISQNIKIIDSE
ncbi:hydrogenase maturation protease [bacterium]|nr:hydrogenase maturation protease [bacterium]